MKKHTFCSKISCNSKLRMIFVAISIFTLGILVGKYLPQQEADVYLSGISENSIPETQSDTSSLKQLDSSKKIIANNTVDSITFELDGVNQAHSIKIPQNWILLPTDSEEKKVPFSKGVDYRYAFSNGASIELFRAPTVFRFVDYSNQYVEYDQKKYAHYSTIREGGSIVTSKLNWSKLQYESKTISQDESNTVGNSYYGFLLIPSRGPSQNVVVAVTAPAEVENVEEVVQFILNSLQ